jgi:hypothetical protein
MFAIDGKHPRRNVQASPRTNLDNLPVNAPPVVGTGFGQHDSVLERNCHSVQKRRVMDELNWTKQTIFAGHPGPKTARQMWQTTIDGDVWTLRESPRDLNGCVSIIVERYSQGIRTRFATMPTLKSAADVVVRFVNDR